MKGALKHLLTVQIYEEGELVKQIKKGVGVTGAFEDNLAKVQTMRRIEY